MNFDRTNLTDGEVSLIMWQFNLYGGFYTALWDAIRRADAGHLARLGQAFPDEVGAYHKFCHRAGYWEDVCDRAKINRDTGVAT